MRSPEAAWGAVGLSAVIRQSWYAGEQDSRCVMWYQKRTEENRKPGTVVWVYACLGVDGVFRVEEIL